MKKLKPIDLRQNQWVFHNHVKTTLTIKNLRVVFSWKIKIFINLNKIASHNVLFPYQTKHYLKIPFDLQ